MIRIWPILLVFVIVIFSLSGCVERGKPVKKDDQEQQAVKNNTKKVTHYICNNGHKGSDKQGVCPECNTAYTHNQAFHGLTIPKDRLNDPFNSNSNTQTATTPAQNAFGDYHYICPNGHSGGSGTAGNCTSCKAKLTHNQLYHK